MTRGTPILAPAVHPLHAILHHALGLRYADHGARLVDDRNHFMTGPGSDDYVLCMALVGLGLMVCRGQQRMAGGDYLFSVTDQGRQVARASFPQPPKLTRSQLRYQAFLDADCGLSFGEWLKHTSRPERTEWAEGLA